MKTKSFTNTESAQNIRDEQPPRQENKNKNNNENPSHPFGEARMAKHKYQINIAQAAEPKKSSACVDTGTTHSLFYSKSVFMSYTPITQQVV